MRLPVSKDLNITQKKRGTAMPRLQLKVLGKPVRTDMVIAAHAYSVGTTMQTSCSLF